jgi:ABC-2 type transport system ATP-binding protein
LHKKYGKFEAVNSLSLDVPAGSIYGFVGPNGAGKTTTIGMLTTRVKPTQGRAFIGGIDVAQHPAMAKRYIGVVTQSNSLDRALTVEENLYYHGLYFGMSAGESKRRTDELLELFLLKDRARAEVEQLSGGMAQRLMIARALVHRPLVLFLDEPTSGIDPQTRLVLWDIIRELNRQGNTILITTHYMEEADLLCNRIAIMDHGRILANDTPAALKRAIDADTVIQMRIQGPADTAIEAVRSLAGVRAVESADGSMRVYAGNDSSLVASVVGATARAGADVRDLTVNPPTLETVFIQLTGRDLRE